MSVKEFISSIRNGKLRYSDGSRTDRKYDIPDGVIAHLTRTCGGNVHDRIVVEVTSSGTQNSKDPDYVAKNATDLCHMVTFTRC
jgi:hypothetical protein